MADSPKEELQRRIAGYPKEALSFFDGGFVAASKLSQSTRDLVLKEVIDNFKRGTRNLAGSALRALTKLSERESEQLASVYSLVIGLLSDSTATSDDFVSSAKGILFDPAQEATAKSIADSICASRQEINTTVDRAQLAGMVLPSLDNFQIVIDVRIRVADGEVKTFVPVAVTHIGTDVGEEMWLQMTMGDVEETIRKLSKSLEDMKLAETLAFRKI